MTTRTPRSTQPRRWTSLALTSATLGLAAASPLFGGGVTLPHLPTPQTLPLTLVQEAEGEGGEAASPASTAAEGEGGEAAAPAATEGGEGGEAGATTDLPEDVAYLTQLSLVEGHMRAAALLYAKGQADDAIGLSYHPEAEMMDEVRARLAAHGAADITPAMTAFSEAMEQGADQATVTARLADIQAAIAAGQAVEADELPTRFAALTALVKAAEHEYEESIAEGTVQDVMAWHESWAFLEVARSLATALATHPDAKAAAAAAKVLTALDGAAPAFGDLQAATPLAGDAGILSAVAGRVELAASQVR